MSTTKPLGTIQVDVDDLWVYYESIGLRTPADTPALIYEQGIPRLLDLFDDYGIRATFFVVGRDLPAQRAAVQEMTRRGHEIANHSTWHRPGFARLTRAERRADIATTHQLLADAAGQPPVGFKSPGFSLGPDQLDVLGELGYLYDSSLLPTFYAPALRGLQRVLSGGQVDPTQYGQPRYGLAPLQPYHPDRAAPYRRHPGSPHPGAQDPPAAVWEAPVTTLPLLRLPMHSTFVFSSGQPLFDLGLALARARRVPVNYLLHAADVVDCVPDPALASYKFLARAWPRKQPLYRHMLAELSQHYQLVPTRDYVAAAASGLL